MINSISSNENENEKSIVWFSLELVEFSENIFIKYKENFITYSKNHKYLDLD